MSEGAGTQPSAQPRKRPLLIGLIAIAAGIGLAYLAWRPIADIRHLAATGVRAEARVNTVEEQRRRSGSTYYPIFVFRTQDGRVVRERSAVPVSSPEPYLGRTVTVVYAPGDLSSVRSVQSLAEGAGQTPWIAGALALLALGFAAFVLLTPPAKKVRGPSQGG